MPAEWGTAEWFEQMCDPACADSLGDRWGHRWRGLQQLRYSRYLSLLKPVVAQSGRQLDILDIGCAFGDFTEKVYALNPHNRIYGIDISENAIKVVTERLPNLSFKVNSLPDLSFPDSSFDLVLCLEVLYYLDRGDRAKGIDSIKKVLKPGGYLMLSGPLDGGKRYFDREEILKLVSEKGFEIKKVRYSYHKLYVPIEQRLLKMLNLITGVRKICEMSEEEFRQWLAGKQPNSKITLVKLIRKGGSPVSRLLRLSESLVRSPISSKAVPASFQVLNRAFFMGKNPSSITILAKATN